MPKTTATPRGKVEFYQDTKKRWHWRFVLNGRTMAESGRSAGDKGYTRERDAWRAWDDFTGHLVRGRYQTIGDEISALRLAVLAMAARLEGDSIKISGAPPAISIPRGVIE